MRDFREVLGALRRFFMATGLGTEKNTMGGDAAKLRAMIWEEAIDKAIEAVANSTDLPKDSEVFRNLELLRQAHEEHSIIKVPAELFRTRPLLAAFEIVKVLNADKMRIIDNSSYKIFLNLSEYNTMLSRAIGFFEKSKFLAIEQILRSGDYFADLGGNKGDFSLFASTIVGPSGRVVCFEPLPDNANWVRKSIGINGFENVRVMEACVSDEVGEIVLYVGRKSGWNSIFETRNDAPRIKCKSVTLDSFIQESGWSRLDCAKIDIEGAELKAIKGALDVMHRLRPIMFIDVHRRAISSNGVKELEGILLRHQYKIFDERSLNEVSQREIGRSAIAIPEEKVASSLQALRKVM